MQKRMYYELSDNRKSNKKSVEKTENSKRTRKAFEQSEDGKQIRSAYELSEEGKQTRRIYKTNRKLKRFESDTGFNVICVSCNEYKSHQSCVNTMLQGNKGSRFTENEEIEYLIKDPNFNRSIDGEYHICYTCLNQIKSLKEMIENSYNIVISLQNCLPKFKKNVAVRKNCKMKWSLIKSCVYQNH